MSEPGAIAAASAAAIVAMAAMACENGFSSPNLDDNPRGAVQPSTDFIASAMTRATA